MGPRSGRKHHVWCLQLQPLTALMEGPRPEEQGDRSTERRWDAIRAWVRTRMEKRLSGNHFKLPFHENGSSSSKRMDLELVLGVLGCPLAPIPLPSEANIHFSIKDSSIDTCSGRYIIHQYLAATGCLKLEQCIMKKSMYVAGSVRMVCSNRERRNAGGGANGYFVLWQMSPGMWLVELEATGYKVVAGSNGRIVWRNLPWLGMNAAKVPQRPLRRFVQGLDPKCTASMFTKAQCLGEKRVGDDDCFVLKVSTDPATIAERREGTAEVIRHVLYGYFSQKSGLLVYMEDSHLSRFQSPGSGAIYWETTIGSNIEDYRDVEGILIAHQGRSVATLFRFGEASAQHSRTRMEEAWRIDDVAFNIPGLSIDCFIPPMEILNAMNGSSWV